MCLLYFSIQRCVASFKRTIIDFADREIKKKPAKFRHLQNFTANHDRIDADDLVNEMKQSNGF